MDNKVMDIQSTAANLINQLAIILRTAHIHSTDNVAFTNAASHFTLLMNDLLKNEHEFILQLRGDFFYLNDDRVRYSPKHLLNFDYLAEEFKKAKLGTIIVKKEIGMEVIKHFIHSFLETDFFDQSFDYFAEKMRNNPDIKIKELEKIDYEDKLDVKRMIRRSYFNAVFYIKGVINKVKSGEDVDIRRAKRVVTSLVDTIVDHEQTLLGMTTIKDYDEYTYVHCTNVSIYSVALGQRIGLSRQMLINLGIASLFHDLGKIEVPHTILNKPDNLVEAEWRIMKKHPVWGVKSILKLRDIDELTVRSAFVAFEHHMNLNHSGYPMIKNRFDLDLFSKIVSIADRYDAITSARVYSKTAMTSEKALSTLMEQAGYELDPLLVKFFINMIGIYPIGSLVKLDSDELALVFENNQESLLRPRVMLITDTKGNWIESRVVDLTEKNDNNTYIRSIGRTMDHRKYGINIAEYLL